MCFGLEMLFGKSPPRNSCACHRESARSFLTAVIILAISGRASEAPTPFLGCRLAKAAREMIKARARKNRRRWPAWRGVAN